MKKKVIIGLIVFLLVGSALLIYDTKKAEKRQVSEGNKQEQTLTDVAIEDNPVSENNKDDTKEQFIKKSYEAPIESGGNQVFIFGEDNGLLIITESPDGEYSEMRCKYDFNDDYSEVTIYYPGNEKMSFPFGIKEKSIVVNGLEYKETNKTYAE